MPRRCMSEEVDELIKTTPPDQLIEKLAELIGWGFNEIHDANLEEKLTEQQIFQLLSMRTFGDRPVLHRLIENNPTSSTVKLLKQITDEDQFSQLIFVKDDKYLSNSLLLAITFSNSDVVRYIYTRLNKDKLYKLLCDPDKNGNTSLHWASRRDYPLDELLEPFTATESHKLLSIRNTAGLTVDDIEQSLKRGASSQEIDEWFESTPSEVLIGRLAWSMLKWGYEDLDGLNLEERLTAGQIVDLLKTKPGPYRYDLPVLHQLIGRNPTFAGKLLKHITDEDQFKQLIFMKDDEGLTVLSSSIRYGRLKLFQFLIEFYSDRQSELLDLGTIPDNEGNTSFHYAAGRDTSRYLTELIQTTLTFKMRRRFIDALEKKNARNEIFKSPRSSRVKPHPANSIIYQWALESTKKRQYLLFHYPKVLIFSNEAKREGAKEEAGVLIACFQSHEFKVDVKPNRKKQDMLDDLKEASKSKTGLIVAIMSHGGEGYILDNERERIDIKEIEENMTHHDRTTPKCLILQTCQGSATGEPNDRNLSESMRHQSETLNTEHLAAAPASTEAAPSSERTPEFGEEIWASPVDAGPSYNAGAAYIPRSRHLCVFMSTIPGRTCERNKYIPAFVKAIDQLEPDSCISEAHKVTNEELYLETPGQKPVFQSLLIQSFCIKNALPLFLKRAGVDDEEVGKIIRGAVINGQREPLGGAQGGAVGGSVFEPTDEA